MSGLRILVADDESIVESDLVQQALGEHVFRHFIENKKVEWDRFRTHVTQYEIDTTLPVL